MAVKDYSVLLLSPQPRAEIQRLGLPLDIQERRFRDALGLFTQPERITTCYVADEGLPENIQADAVIIGGSIHGAYENLPWIKPLEVFIKKIAEDNIPLLGICFGHQVISQALGGKVVRAETAEVGIVNVQLAEGSRDPLFSGMPGEFFAGARHFDEVVVVPPGAVVLAYSPACRNQSLSIGNNIRTVQFHPELDGAAIEFLLKRKRHEKIGGEIGSVTDFEELLETIKNSPVVDNGKKILQNFVENFI